jgi:hypothetical protein
MIGHNSKISISGSDHFLSRICSGNICGRLFCPIGSSELNIDVDLGKYRISVHDVEKNKNWNKDQKLLHANAVLGRIQEHISTKQHKIER